jgi:hypothetical protein
MIDSATAAPADPLATRRGARIARRCPGCGAAIEHGEEDGAVGCDFCGLRLAIGAGAGIPAYAAAPRGVSGEVGAPGPAAAPMTWQREAKKALRAAGERVRSFEPPRAILAPFHRLRAHVWQWYLEVPRRELLAAGISSAPPLTMQFPAEPEPRSRFGIWDSTIDAVPSLRLGPGNLSFRTQTLVWTPMADFLAHWPTLEPDCAVLEAEIGNVEARDLLGGRLSEAWQPGPDTAGKPWTLVTDAVQQRMYAPVLLCPFLGPQGRAAITLDGVTLHPGRVLTGEELSRIESAESAARERPPEALSAGPSSGDTPGVLFAEGAALVPLSCPECSAPLPFAPRARVHRCDICGRHWIVRGNELAPVPWVVLRAATSGRRPTRPVFLPFYRLRSAGEAEWFVPAAQGRNPRAAWNLALGLAKCPHRWEEEELADSATAGTTVTGRVAPGGPAIAIETTPDTAGILASFVAHCLEQPSPAQVQTELAWIAFQPSGPDLVEPGSGLGVPRQAFTPWEAPVAAIALSAQRHPEERR